ncbi:structural maintenance of chromosomes protein 2 [Bacillus rossius redtenbacheri]|uniref:structural maintenance of chromosomes protein 2 n=1 Tax=Bacillus rossius redtenbacheri TaxID=93214 RepID=UPI002FDCE5F6
MYIKSMIIEGFKSYGQRVEINGFDKEFNAITGLNGTGKSNILDAICFVLGITNLSNVRATTLQELVYKSGQAGVTKASVTITFDNTNPKQCPLGFEQHKEITITRQVVIGGKNKYLINGTNCQNKRVQDLFCSVQLNVNNPHFLIMQGRITKVLNMKPEEILAMIEEAAGTRMYEAKKQSAQALIVKKDAKLKEIKTVIQDEVSPSINKLKSERQQYLEYQKMEREKDYYQKIYIAWRYTMAQDTCNEANGKLSALHAEIEAARQKIKNWEQETKALDALALELQQKKEAEGGGKLQELEAALKAKEKVEAQLVARQKGLKDSIAVEEKNKKQLLKGLKEDESVLAGKKAELGKVGATFERMKEEEQADQEALAAAERKFQAVSSGLLTNDDGLEATLEDQLMSARQALTQADTGAKQAAMQLQHCERELKQKRQEMNQTSSQYKRDEEQLRLKERQLQALEKELSTLDYEDGKYEHLQEVRHGLLREKQQLRDEIDTFNGRNPGLSFQYRDPETNFNRASVKGLVCRLLTVKDGKAARALETAAGGKLYNVVVDTELTSKKLLERGQLRRRTTIIPLNKIRGSSMDQRTVRLAENLVGKENVQPALSLISYERDLHSAMEWVYGQVFICKDMESARKVTFHNQIMKKSVTYDGDVVDPGGTLSGGAPPKTAPIFTLLERIKTVEQRHAEIEQKVAAVELEIRSLSKVAERYNSLKQNLELRRHEVELVRAKLQQTTHHKYQEEVNSLQATVDELHQKIQQCKKTMEESERRVKNLEGKMKNSKSLREKALKDAEKEMNRLKQKAGNSSTQWKQREQDYEGLKLEIVELEKSIENGKQQIAASEENFAKLSAEFEQLKGEVDNAKESVKEMQAEVKKQKDLIHNQNKEIHQTIHKKEKLLKEMADLELDIKKKEHEVTKVQNEAKDCHNKLAQLAQKYEWIEADKMYFGQPNSAYDFSEHSPQEAGRRAEKLQEQLEKAGRSLNVSAMAMLTRKEEEYENLKSKRKIVEQDRAKLCSLIEDLDRQKATALRSACEKVNKDFGSIFCMLLPGTQACLRPPEGRSMLEGLEIKVAFGEVWKENLAELSGGQRSLVALSLILSLLLFKPAPIYILDEVDSALDLSHTQNIGKMLRKHFRHSQFIIVSLKDGMFSNANVLFRTSFVDGMSRVTRTVQRNPEDK